MTSKTKNKKSGMFDAFLAERRKYRPDEPLQDAIDAVEKLVNSKDMSGKYKGKTRDALKIMNKRGLKGGGTLRVLKKGPLYKGKKSGPYS